MKFDDLDIKMRVYETSHDFSQNEASSKIEKLSIADKNELLFQYGVNFNELPNWQKREL